jgi:hypothetical protein
LLISLANISLFTSLRAWRKFAHTHTYIYIYLHLPSCAEFQTLMWKTPLPHEGQKQMSRGWNPFLIRTGCDWLLKFYFPEEILARLPNNTSKPLHMNFSTWDTPQVNHFIWISLRGTPQKWATL